MLLFAPQPAEASETRTPLTPATVKKLVALGLDVAFEPGLGRGALIDDDALTDAGAAVAGGGHRAWEDADIVAAVTPPGEDDVKRMRDGALLAGLLAPTRRPGLVRAAAEAGVSTLSAEFIPRISRAQSMDVLSSQANLAGYKAVLLGAAACPKLMPMLITAAGTLSPGRVLVVGVGVAGLQAIATAKRLGAVVEAYDVRPPTKEQVQSLGARFVELPPPEEEDDGGNEDSGGYAKEQSEAQRLKQAELMAKHVAGADVVVTTAAVFGKAPPLLIPADVVATMKPGSVVVDLGASADHGRGNCELTRPDETFVTDRRVTVMGPTNLPGTMPVHASAVLANNFFALLETVIRPGDAEREEGEPGPPAGPTLHLDLDDEVHVGALITHRGQVVNDLVRGTLEPAPESGTEPETEAPS
ncbi:MAG: NAD(P) transhydrogenase subunit alpha [Planctomycetota bacterium]